MRNPRLWADLIVALHVGYVSFVVVGLVLILLGWWLGWKWIRGLWLRLAHLAAIGIVALEAIFNIECPLTVWEHQLREQAGEKTTGEGFIGRCLHNLIFYDLPSWAFTVAYVAFAILVIGLFILVPPQRKRIT